MSALLLFTHLVPIAAGVFLSVLGLVVILNRTVDRYHAYFSLFLFTASAWSIAVGLFLSVADVRHAYWLAISFYIAALLISYAVLMFARAAPSKIAEVRSQRYFLDTVLLAPIVCIAVWLIAGGGFITGVHADGQHNSVTLALGWYGMYAAVFLAYAASAVVILTGKYRGRTRRLTSPYRRGLRLVSGTILTGMLFGAFFNLILPIFGEYSLIWVGPIGIIPSGIVFWYAIIRHGLFDVRLIVVRTIGYILSVVTLAGVYVLLAYVVSQVLLRSSLVSGVSFSSINIGFALVLAIIFQPVKSFFDRITNKIFYRHQYRTEEFFATLSNVLSVATDLRSLLQDAAAVIAGTLKSGQAFFYVRHDAHHVVAGTSTRASLLVHEARQLDTFATKREPGVVIVANINRHQDIYSMLSRKRIELLLPLWHDGAIMGYFALGDALGTHYTARDITALETIADELVIAIQNALSLEEVRDVNASLQTRIDNATHSLRVSNDKLRQLDDTKDEFISMASHQLRTPLTSVKGYVSMILDGDAGPINPQQRKFLTEAFDSSTRMAGIIGDFLNVSRLQTGKFSLEREPLNLADIVATEVDHLETAADARGLTLNFAKPKLFPSMSLDKSKLEQVIMNLIDNAIFYAPDTGSIDIRLAKRDGNAVFTVKDRGIGVPASEQRNLFTKFFRATNARYKRPDGTGVGLFLAKKVVLAHGGTIIFESREGKGSTFGFSLPIKSAIKKS